MALRKKKREYARKKLLQRLQQQAIAEKNPKLREKRFTIDLNRIRKPKRGKNRRRTESENSSNTKGKRNAQRRDRPRSKDRNRERKSGKGNRHRNRNQGDFGQLDPKLRPPNDHKRNQNIKMRRNILGAMSRPLEPTRKPFVPLNHHFSQQIDKINGNFGRRYDSTWG